MDTDISIEEKWFSAAEQGNIHLLQKLRSEISDINITCNFTIEGIRHKNVTALIICAFHGVKDIIRWFIEQGADPNIATKSGWRAVHFAAYRGHVSTLDMLCQAGALVNVITEDGESPVYLAIRKNMRDTVRKLIVTHEANIEDIDYMTLMKASRRGLLPPDITSKLRVKKRSTPLTSNSVKEVLPRGNSNCTSELVGKRVQSLVRNISEDSKWSKLALKLTRKDSLERRISAANRLLEMLQHGDPPKPSVKILTHLVPWCEACAIDTMEEDFTTQMAQLSSAFVQKFWTPDEIAELLETLLHRCLNPKNEPTRTITLQYLATFLALHDPSIIERAFKNPDEVIRMFCQCLENLDYPDNVSNLVDVMLRFSLHFPDSLANDFPIIVDILVGWCVDDMTKNSLCHRLTLQLTEFRGAWQQHSDFTLPLMTNLLEDVEKYVTSPAAGKTETDELIDRRFFIFVNILEAVIQLTDSPNDSDSMLTHSCVNEFVRKILDICDMYQQPLMNENFIQMVNNAVTLLLKQCYEVGNLSMLNKVKNYLLISIHYNKTNDVVALPKHSFSSSLLALIDTFFRCYPHKNKFPDMLYQLFGPHSVIHKMKHSSNTDIINQLATIMDYLIKVAQSSRDALYQIFLSDLEVSLRVLVTASVSNYEVALVQANAFETQIYTSSVAEALAMFNFVGVSLLTVGGSSVDIWKLEPPLFYLFSRHLPLFDDAICRVFPRLYHAMIMGFIKVCQQHEYFKPPFDDNQRELHFKQMCDCLARLVTLPAQNNTTIECLLDFIMETVEALMPTFRACIEGLEALICALKQTLNCAFNRSNSVLLKCLKILTLILRSYQKWSSQIYLDLCSVLFGLLSHKERVVSNAAIDLTLEIPLNEFINVTHTVTIGKSNYLKFTDDKTALLDKGNSILRQFMQCPPSECFSATTAQRSVFKYIVSGRQPQSGRNFAWLRRQMQLCQRFGEEDNENEILSRHLLEVAESCDNVLWHWAAWCAAEHCISSKLKVEPGMKPIETFMSIENCLKEMYSTLITNSVETHGGVIKTPVKSNIKFGSENWQNQLKHVSIMLTFMDVLEKLIYNAQEGSAVSIALPNKPVRVFFRTNKATCQEWLNRIRMLIMQLAWASGQPAIVIRHGVTLLQQDCSHADPEEVMVMIGKAMRQLGSTDSLIGLYKWAKEKYSNSRKYLWIRALAFESEGKWEKACKLYDTQIRNRLGMGESDGDLESKKEVLVLSKTSNIPPHSLKLCSQKLVELYYEVGDFDEMLKRKGELEDYQTKSTAMNIPKSAFDTDIDWAEISHLKNLGSWSDSRQCDNPSSSPSHIHSWSVGSIFETCHESLLQQVDHPTSSHTRHVYETVRDVIHSVSNVWPACITPESYLLLKKCQLLRQSDIEPSIRLEYDRDESPYGADGVCNVQMLQFRDLLVRSESQNTCQTNSPVTISLSAVKWARKNDNNSMASRLLLRELRKATSSNFSVNNFVKDSFLSSVKSLRLSTKPLEPLIHLQVEREAAKVMWRDCKQELAIYLLSDSMLESILTETGDPVLHSTKCELNTKSLLTLFNWLQADETISRKLCSLIQQAAKNESNSDALLGDPLVHAAHNLASLSDLTDIPWINGVPLVSPNSHLASVTSGGGSGANLIPVSPRLSDVNVDTITGRLLMLTSRLSAQKTQSWFSLADWCFNRGFRNLEEVRKNGGLFSLTVDDETNIHKTLAECECSVEEVSKIQLILRKHRIFSSTKDENENDLLELEEEVKSSGYVDDDQALNEISRQIIEVCPNLKEVECVSGESVSDPLSQLLKIRRDLLSRHYTLYLSAVRAYLTFLSVNTVSASGDNPLAMQQNISATLRLIRLLMKHSLELRDAVIKGIARSPPHVWLGIIPQLLAQLSTTCRYQMQQQAPLRHCLVELLSRLAVTRETQHLVVFPVLVGLAGPPGGGQTVSQSTTESNFASRNQRDLNVLNNDEVTDDLLLEDQPTITETEDDANEENDHSVKVSVPIEEKTDLSDEQEGVLLRSCFQEITENLSAVNPILVSEMTGFVEEMSRITVLWDELWLGSINQNMEELQRKVNQLDNELRKVESNSNLNEEERQIVISGKYEAILRPTIFTLEKLAYITGGTAETPHEQWFQETFGQLIKDTLESLKNPANPSQPQASYQAIRQLYHFMYQRSQRHNKSSAGCSSLTLDVISPKLLQITSELPMPGVEGIRLIQLDNTIQVLPTKTKPKKLHFIGSDGRSFPYLFKGLEDLHLDERVMQFLGIINHMFSHLNKKQVPRYHARNYSVTPLGPRSGLIQMVEHATPLFTLYKRWQQRQVSISPTANSDQQQQANNSHIPRPSEIFFSKLTPALEAKNIRFNPDDKKDLDNRKNWPVSVLKEVLSELINETPNDLLSKELWCASVSSLDWWQISQCFCRSLAVMSMIGYILGLGDRHLDNVMVDLCTGEVVHIDYNVCFEKGHNLRVPETVPFRLTHILEYALGLGGVQGGFRLSCEKVLGILRDGGEMLLSLLETFVCEPLLDWRPGVEAGYTGAHFGGRTVEHRALEKAGFGSRREIEKQINLQFLGVRILEIKTVWLENQTLVMDALKDLNCELSTLHSYLDDLVAFREKYHLDNEIVKYLEKDNIKIESLKSRCTIYQNSQMECDNLFKKLANRALEMEEFSAKQAQALDELFTGRIVNLVADAFDKGSVEVEVEGSIVANFMDPVRDFLVKAGQVEMTKECDHLLSQINEAMSSRRQTLNNCLEVLNSYKSIIALYQCPHYLHHDRFYHLSDKLRPLKSIDRSDRSVEMKDFEKHGVTVKYLDDVINDYEQTFVNPHITEEAAGRTAALEEKLKTIVERLQADLSRQMSERNSLQSDSSNLSPLSINQSLIRIFTFVNDRAPITIQCYKSVLAQHLMEANRDLISVDDLLYYDQLTEQQAGQYLDDLTHMISVNRSLLSFFEQTVTPVMFNSPESVEPVAVIKVLSIVEETFVSFRNLRRTFSNILVPECLRIISSTPEPVITYLLNTLHHAFKEAPQILQFFDNLTVESSLEYDSKFSHVTQAIRDEMSHLLEQKTNYQSCQMLLLGFNHLFNKLMGDMARLIEAFHSLFIPDMWYYVDLINNSSSRLPLCWSNRASTIILDVVYLRGIQALLSLLEMCQSSARVFHTPHSSQSPREHYIPETTLLDPINNLLFFLCQRVTAGIPAIVLGMLFTSIVEDQQLSITQVVHNNGLLGSELTLVAESLMETVMSMHQMEFHAPLLTSLKHQMSGYITQRQLQESQVFRDERLGDIEARLQRAQKTLASYQWLHERVLYPSRTSEQNQLVHPSRYSVLNELRKMEDQLEQHDDVISGLETAIKKHEVSIENRLKWAQGSNPLAVGEMMSKFDALMKQKILMVKKEQSVSGEVLRLCRIIVQFEKRKFNGPEVEALDEEILSLLNQCKEELGHLEVASQLVSDLEVKIVQFEGKLSLTGADWAKNLKENLSNESSQIIHDYHSVKCDAEEKLTVLEDYGARLKQSLMGHGKLMNEVKPLLKTLSRLQAMQKVLTAPISGSHPSNLAFIRDYLSVYRQFTDSLNMLTRFTSCATQHSHEILELQDTSTDNLFASVTNLCHSAQLLIDCLVPNIYGQLIDVGPQLLSLSTKKTDRSTPCDSEQQTESIQEEKSVQDVTNDLGALMIKSEQTLHTPGTIEQVIDLSHVPPSLPTSTNNNGAAPLTNSGRIDHLTGMRSNMASSDHYEIGLKSKMTLPHRALNNYSTVPVKLKSDFSTVTAIYQPPIKNSTALTVWRRSRDKLTGRHKSLSGSSTDQYQVLSIESQVEAAVKQATDLDQLALMYEGWTAWV